ncbi:MAG: hypothetical protein UW81_C0009G0007 [Candidatus Giovannonibacteria bacterium GW2011_GWC2_44_9]|uniref:Uncharacterized protein n=3 Tax=Candidatus Giovannoniibacteriota TaxID=1752738 RepID=A0A0G1IX94_9BACT|nr:MAG: hypothetical protein UW49_C0007G0017 [Candidatus Giovannonibacteria bacterium GW2011_GWB1_44_23]KKT64021.1 MAG: hypothetical protein UW57_C0003G0015 [Candidatus Giovannonibacteria bacterium GW2011_GWA1_44_29]KKT83887.1 MAG: hypothetical protein UW81_C0009G0007 [Candidatus Giovannonibacteria bacterium GW2011_GWC2_44_9]KKT91869.1 MAG: hypothetical protein UW93_C0002G0016 [Parcubacteria group bacterium GW2011_GWC1_45_13]
MEKYFFGFLVLALLYLVFSSSSTGDEVGKDHYGHYVCWGPRYHRVCYRKSDIIVEEIVHLNAWFPLPFHFRKSYKVKENDEVIKFRDFGSDLYTTLKCLPGAAEAALEEGRLRLGVYQSRAKT